MTVLSRNLGNGFENGGNFLVLEEKEIPPRKEPSMKIVLRISRAVKDRRARVDEILDLPAKTMEVNARTELIQA